MVKRETLTGILRNDPKVMGRHYRNFSDNVSAFNFARKNSAECYHEISLYNKNLERRHFPGINFEKADLGHANLDRTNFENANLRRARFDYTYADGAIFRNADLKGCRGLYKIDHAEDADFENADLRGASFRLSENDCCYDHIMLRLLKNARFSGTKITPEQKERLQGWFLIPESWFKEKFIVLPRGKYYGGPNEFFYEKGLEAYEQAKKESKIFTEKVNGKNLEYALVPVEGNEDIFHRAGFAFSLCKTSEAMVSLLGGANAQYKGDWLYFVFDNVPKQFREFAAIHEFYERLGGGHREATIKEFERAKSKGMFDEYLSWLVASFPDKLIANAVHHFKSDMEQLPDEVVEATKNIRPKSAMARRSKLENGKRGLQTDIWRLSWKGLPETAILEALVVRGYGTNMDAVNFWREQMEIPDCKAIQKLTYLEPY